MTRPATPEWQQDAACLDTDAEAFFPDSYENSHAVSQAQQICGRCPVADTCLTWALAHGVDHGIWGGATPRQRSAAAKQEAA